MIKKLILTIFLIFIIPFKVQAFEEFQIKDIKIEGIERIELGTVFNYLPIKVGDNFNKEKSNFTINTLFKTGYFNDIKISNNNDILIISLKENPVISEILINGSKVIDEDDLLKILQYIEIAEAKIFRQSSLDRVNQIIKNEYLNRGRYGILIRSEVINLERNRVKLIFNIDEGEVSKIKTINIFGNKKFNEKVLKRKMKLRTPGFWTWLTRNDQYSKVKLEADLEKIRSFYLDQGYLEFSINSTQVSISPDKKDIFISLNVYEGEKFTVNNIEIIGESIVSKDELRKLLKLKKGNFFSRKKLTSSTDSISNRLGQEGYAFAIVNASPKIDRERNLVDFDIFIEQGKKIYIRRINIVGNTLTRDEVIRREIRQIEGSWYSNSKIKRSKQRIDKLGFFSEVKISTPAVSGTSDQVDIDVEVVERATGSLMLGIGYSSEERVMLSGSITQRNIFGTGNSLGLSLNTGEINQNYSLSYTNPYYTDSGISRGFDLYKKDTDVSSLDVSEYNSNTLGFGVRYRVPLTEYDSINYGVAYEDTDIRLGGNPGTRYTSFVDEFGTSSDSYVATLGWSRDQRDSFIYPNEGTFQKLNAEVGIPGGDLTYYKLHYQHQLYYPINDTFTFFVNNEVGYASGFESKTLPFYKNYYVGGSSSVRGYKASSIGPKDSSLASLGGSHKLLSNIELLFPVPGLEDAEAIRGSFFLDEGYVGESFDFNNEIRASVGFSLSWFSPIGPLRFSIAEALNDNTKDRTERIQFTLGTIF